MTAQTLRYRRQRGTMVNYKRCVCVVHEMYQAHSCSYAAPVNCKRDCRCLDELLYEGLNLGSRTCAGLNELRCANWVPEITN